MRIDRGGSKLTVISLTTDFGLQDEYVGVMQGVILTAAPDIRIVDLCHGIEPQNVVQAAFMIATAYRHFPPGTLHLLVVDPGVGGARRIIYAEADGHRQIERRRPIPRVAARQRRDQPTLVQSASEQHFSRPGYHGARGRVSCPGR